MSNYLVLTVLVFYAVIVLLAGLMGAKKKTSLDEMNIASKSNGMLSSAFSISATWIWAPALFVASERAYVNGLLGFGWFFVPNVLSLILFSYVSKYAIRKVQKEHTLSELMGNVYTSERVKKIYNFELLFLAGCSMGVQLLAGGRMLNLLTGLNFGLITIILAGVSLTYSYFSGIKASVKTDVIQMVMMIVAVVSAVLFFLPRGEIDLGGINNVTTRIFSMQNWQFFTAFGLTTTIGLLSGPIGDQTFWQRAFSMKPENVKKSFFIGSLMFAIVPLGMAFIGFIASGSNFAPESTSTVGLEYIMAHAPQSIVIIFMLCIISGISSTLDSAMCAVGSIISTHSEKTRTVAFARLGMVGIMLFGIVVANIPNMDIFWLFLFYGVLRSSVAVPTLATMISKRKIEESYLFNGILGAFLIGVPIYSYGAILGNRNISFTGTILTLAIPTIAILLSYARGGDNEDKKV